MKKKKQRDRERGQISRDEASAASGRKDACENDRRDQHHSKSVGEHFLVLSCANDMSRWCRIRERRKENVEAALAEEVTRRTQLHREIHRFKPQKTQSGLLAMRPRFQVSSAPKPVQPSLPMDLPKWDQPFGNTREAGLPL